ncbi:unnamed protein product, partial [Pylaiella littoralis]
EGQENAWLVRGIGTETAAQVERRRPQRRRTETIGRGWAHTTRLPRRVLTLGRHPLASGRMFRGGKCRRTSNSMFSFLTESETETLLQSGLAVDGEWEVPSVRMIHARRKRE